MDRAKGDGYDERAIRQDDHSRAGRICSIGYFATLVQSGSRRNTKRQSGGCLSMINNGSRLALGATEGDVKPEAFPLGSPQSRAAARARLQRQREGRERIELILDIGYGIEDLKIGEWTEGDDGSLSRISIIPDGMSMEEAERIWAGGKLRG